MVQVERAMTNDLLVMGMLGREHLHRALESVFVMFKWLVGTAYSMDITWLPPLSLCKRRRIGEID